MSSLSGGNFNPGISSSGGIQMSDMGQQLPDGGGSFYMGDEGQQGQQQQQQQNPDLVFVDQALVDQKSQGRQYLEGLITGKDSSWTDPWNVKPGENMRTRGRKDFTSGKPQGRKQLLINA